MESRETIPREPASSKGGYPEEGTPQGGVICQRPPALPFGLPAAGYLAPLGSPLLSNIYLHEVLDKWFVESVQPACQGRTFMVRWVDDFVMGFERLEDVRKVQRVIGKRFARYGLKINAEKTRLVRFKRPPRGGERPGGKSGTFDFLGFTHYWGKSRKGSPVVKTKTAATRFRRTLRKIREWGWNHRHLPMKEQQAKLNEMLRGHDAYYGVTGNYRKLSQLRREVARIWRTWLVRRNRGRSPNWEKFDAMLRVFPLCPPRIVHSKL